MRRYTKSPATSPDIIENTQGLTQANFNLLMKLIHWLVDNEQRKEKRRIKYRSAMIQRLTRIEAAVSLILVGQRAQTQYRKPFFYADKLEASANAAEEFIARQSHQAGLDIIRYIYGEDKSPEPRHDRRRRWSGWEI